LDVTDNVEIRYRWYKEIIGEGDYYPLKDITPNDVYDKTNFKYVESNNGTSAQYCTLSPEYYQIEKKQIREYKKVYNTSYVLIEGINYDNNIKIYYDNKLINFMIISNENNQLKINLKKQYMCDKLLFYIENDAEYTISLYLDLNFETEILSKKLENEKISNPDSTWITENTKFITYTTYENLSESIFNKLIKETTICSYKEKYVYKYNVTKEYYDDNYHSHVDGYIKDINDYKIYYNYEPIVNTVEITKEKLIDIPQVEYVYVEKEIKENDSSQHLECPQEIKKEPVNKITKEIIEKEVFKIPKKMYIIILILLMTIILLIIKLYRKYVE